MRGLPGSGKSYKAAELEKEHNAIIVSADDYFMSDGNYIFEPTKLGAAHASCFYWFMQCLFNGKNVIVDNTNTQKWEYRNYETLAKHFGYEVSIVVMGCKDMFYLVKFHGRQKHGVPMEIMEKMFDRFER